MEKRLTDSIELLLVLVTCRWLSRWSIIDHAAPVLCFSQAAGCLLFSLLSSLPRVLNHIVIVT